ncbi:DUF2127 domain-containing protein [Gordonia sp. NB41Y]|uniref:DUF2127 domain-containing protein n=1 Tax=Gordonia sp. NB41Y TaxID=875808 RepID=UPI0002BFE154|nr:DUF2127 domain-containing protein [Gordonia sp. NB41Y]WLP89737.1 DUF2127 domain-containing protein [Gordonia sp. NB41Y]
MNWELLSCGVRGHHTYRPDEPALADGLHVDSAAGQAWRCLRCGDFVAGPPRGSGPADAAPEVPRGALLRDLIIMRLLAVERLLRGLFLLIAGILVIEIRHSQQTLSEKFDAELPLLKPIADQVGWNIDDSRVVQLIERAFTLSSTTIVLLGCALIVYAASEFVECYGLWFARRWGEYFAVVVTSVFIPLEVYELTERVTVVRVGLLVVNVAAVVWLIWRKRLFGARGGETAYREEHSAASLLTVEHAAVSESGAHRTDLAAGHPDGAGTHSPDPDERAPAR